MTHRLPIYGVQLVREKSLMTQIKMIRSADDANEVVAQYLGNVDREHFVVIMLDTKHRVRGIHTVSIGSLDASIVHPREVLNPQSWRIHRESWSLTITQAAILRQAPKTSRLLVVWRKGARSWALTCWITLSLVTSGIAVYERLGTCEGRRFA